jgi:hypothetical protein
MPHGFNLPFYPTAVDDASLQFRITYHHASIYFRTLHCLTPLHSPTFESIQILRLAGIIVGNDLSEPFDNRFLGKPLTSYPCIRQSAKPSDDTSLPAVILT